MNWYWNLPEPWQGIVAVIGLTLATACVLIPLVIYLLHHIDPRT